MPRSPVASSSAAEVLPVLDARNLPVDGDRLVRAPSRELGVVGPGVDVPEPEPTWRKRSSTCPYTKVAQPRPTAFERRASLSMCPHDRSGNGQKVT